MKEEYCAGVRILIERMATNPEDFADDEYDLPTMQRRKTTKFGHLSKMLEQLLTGRDKARLLESWAEWHYLTKAEQDALLAAYKQMRRVEFDKRIMERVFDDKFYQRQEEEAQAMAAMQQAQTRYLHAQQKQPSQLSPHNNVMGAQPGSLVYVDSPQQNTSGSTLMDAIGSVFRFGSK